MLKSLLARLGWENNALWVIYVLLKNNVTIELLIW